MVYLNEIRFVATTACRHLLLAGANNLVVIDVVGGGVVVDTPFMGIRGPRPRGHTGQPENKHTFQG